MQPEMMRLLLVRDLIPNLMMEAFLSSRSGMIGAVGFQKIAQSHADVVERADKADASLAKLKKAHKELQDHHEKSKAKLSAFVDDVTRIALQREPGTELTDKDRMEAMRLAAAEAAKAVADRSDLADCQDEAPEDG